MKLLSALTVLLSVIAASPAAEMQATVVQKRYTSELPGDLPFMVKPFGSDTGVQLGVLVTGEELTGVLDDSLKVEQILDAKGANIALNRSGDPIAKLGFSPKASEDGKYISFDIEISKYLFATIGKNSFKGSLKIIHGGTLVSAEAKLDPTTVKTCTLGGYDFSYTRDADGDGSLESDKNDALLSQVKLFNGDQEIDSGGTSSMNKHVSRSFNKVPAGPVTLKIRYWNDAKISDLPLQFAF